MGSCYSEDDIVGDHIHTDIRTCNTEEPQQKNRLGTDNNRLLGRAWGGREGLSIHLIHVYVV